MKYQYKIQGMHCNACVEKIKAALKDITTTPTVTLDPPILKFETNSVIIIGELNTRIAEQGHYQLIPLDTKINQAFRQQDKQDLLVYYPILLILAYISGVAVITNFMNGNWQEMMSRFMAGFFLVFSAFKMLDLKGFALGYASYDLLAKKWYFYGFIYPFLELGLGILYLLQYAPTATHIITIIVMGFSSLGVLNALRKKQLIRCACLGTVLNIPLSTITLIEDWLMVVMAVIMLVVV